MHTTLLERRHGFTPRRLATVVLVASLAAAMVPLGKVAHDVYVEDHLLQEAFPNMPAQCAAAIEVSMVFTPMYVGLGEMESRFLPLIHYPYLDLPEGRHRPSSGNAVRDQIRLAQTRQGLAPKAVVGGVINLDDISHLKTSSLEAIGRAFYFARSAPPLALYLSEFHRNGFTGAAVSGSGEITTMRNIFVAAYGHSALEQMLTNKRS